MALLAYGLITIQYTSSHDSYSHRERTGIRPL